MKPYFRHSKATIRDKRWPALRLAAKRRDDWRCVKCSARGRLEVDHIQPVRDAPELAFELTNLQTLCVSCHAKKTIVEAGLQTPITNRDSWLKSIEQLSKGSRHAAVTENPTPPVGDSGTTLGHRWC